MTKPTVTEWVMTLVPGVSFALFILVMGGPWWAAVGFGGVVTEVRQAALRVRQAMAPTTTKAHVMAEFQKALNR